MNPGIRLLIVAIVGGVAAQWLGRLIRLPSIIPLLILGVVVGPEVTGLMPRPETTLGNSLAMIVTLCVAIVLFDGGMSLNRNDLRLAPKAVWKLLSIGAFITFLGATACAHFIAGTDWSVSFLYGSLMIVTGPTVILPLLKNVRVVRRVHAVLLWEGILIDAVGALAAVVTLELVLSRSGVFAAGSTFIGALIVGPAIGAAGGYVLATWLARQKRRGKSDDELDRLSALAMALGIYGVSEALFSESGLAAITFAGLVTSNILRHDADELRRFKGVITTLLVSTLFMVLAANFQLKDLFALWPHGFIAIGVLMLVVRPLCVLASTSGSRLMWREKAFLCWIAPRGIVAASVASLFSLVLKEHGQAMAGEALSALTFLTIIITVLANGLTAYPAARLLGIQVHNSDGMLIAGASEVALRVAGILENHGYPVLLVDTNPELCKRASEAGFRCVEGNALDADWLFQQDLSGIGCLLAMTTSSTVNTKICRNTANALGLPAYAILLKTTLADDAERIKEAGAKTAFAKCIDLVSMNALLSGHTALLRSIVPTEITTPFALPFLPLLVEGRHGIRPFVPLEVLARDAKIIGLQLKADSGITPFEPSFPEIGAKKAVELAAPNGPSAEFVTEPNPETTQSAAPRA